MKILITGFEPFGTVSDNPSQRIVEHIGKQNNPAIITQTLPVDYATAGEKLIHLIDTHQPSAILLLGVAAKRETIALERIAVNINDARIPDNAGNAVKGEKIAENAPVGYWSTLPLDRFHPAVAEVDITVSYSNHAGAYLCNHVFYRARHHLETTNRADVPCGFIHVPSIEAVSLDEQIQAIQACVNILLKESLLQDA
ncbi:MAG: hypothetical protein AAFN11_04605 [Chloroflexota bacterium]